MAVINQVQKTSEDAVRISYTDKDYVNILDDLINSIPGITQKWNTTDANDPGMILVKLMSIIGDMLFFTQDMQALEVYPNSVTQRKNAATIYKLIGYKMHWYRSATCEADAINTYTQSATIPRFCTFTSEDGEIIYTTFKQYDLASNTLNNGTVITVELIQGSPVTPNRVSNNPYPDAGAPWHSIYGYNYTTSDIINNRIYLRNNNIDQDHIIMIDDQNEEWTLMENIYLTTEVGRFFEFGVDSNDNVYLELVDYYTNFNINSFKIFYIISNGEAGQVYANTLTKVTGNVWSRLTQNDNTVVSNVNNFIQFTHYDSTYGYDPETPDEARKNSVLYQNTLDTLITLADFERATLREPGVANVRATDLTNDPGTEVTYYLGDINQDGSINDDDYNLLVKYINDSNANPLTTYQLRLADVNQDGYVNSEDLNCLKEFIHPTMWDIGDINQDGAITQADLEILNQYIANPKQSKLTDFQIRLCDVNQDDKIDQLDANELQKYLNSSRQEKSPFGQINDDSLTGYTAKQTMSTTELLDGFIVKLYIARTDEYETQDTEFDDIFISQIQSDLKQYKMLPLTVIVDLHSIQKYYWTITGKFYTTQPLSRDELQTIIININNLLKYNYSVSEINFNTAVNYKEIIETILSVDNRILMVDLDPITYMDDEGNTVDKREVTGDYSKTIPQIGVNEDGTLQEGVTTQERLNYNFTLDETPILPGSVMIRVNGGQYTLRDNNNGTIYNVNSILARNGSIDYLTGEISLEFADLLTDDLIVDYTKNRATLAPYRNLSTQSFYFDSSALEQDDTRDLV